MNDFDLSPASRQDLLDLWEYIAQDDVNAADRVRDALFEAMSNLAAMPGTGHRRDDQTDEPLRFWSVHRYLIIYRPDTHPLEIVRVVSGYRDVTALLKNE